MQDRAIPFLTLTESTNEYMLATMNDKRKYFINYLTHGKWVWKKLLWNTIWAIKNKYMEVDFTTETPSILIPADMMRFINVSLTDDCNRLRSLLFDDMMDVVPTKQKDCCNICGDTNDYGQCVNEMTLVQKDVIIDENVYVEKIWTRLCKDGSMYEIREVPVKKYNSSDAEEGYEIGKETIEKLICNLEVKECGCVKKTEQNRVLIVTHCGCFVASCQKKFCNSTITRPSTRKPNIKIQDGRIWISGDNVPKWIILSYQTNGECSDEEIMIPEYCLDTVIFGIHARSQALAPNVGPNESRESERKFRAKVQELEEFLNPILMTEFMNAQMAFPLWGSSSDQRDKRFWNEIAIENFGL